MIEKKRTGSGRPDTMRSRQRITSKRPTPGRITAGLIIYFINDISDMGCHNLGFALMLKLSQVRHVG
ncbi:hypothetical protein JCM14469_26430 [Desulfatiferula olefinivorans]